MKLSLKYLFGATAALFIISAIWINPVLALEVNPVQPAEAISYQEPVGVNSSLSATLPSYFFQGMHVGMLDGSGGVLFANGTIINVTRTKDGNHPVPITMGDDLRVDGEIWRGPKKGVADNMPLKISDTMVPTMNDINDLGDSMRRWRNLYLSGTIQAHNMNLSGTLEVKNTKFIGDVDFSNANIIGLNISDGTDPDGTGSESIDADTLNGIDSTGFALNPHDHDGRYLQLIGGTLTGLTSVNATLEVKSGGYTSGGVSITTDGDIMAAGDLTLDGNINANSLNLAGNVDSKGGAILGTGPNNVLITGDGNAYFYGKMIVPNGISVPTGSCVIGEIYLETTTPQMYGCNALGWQAL